jgi:hypothetical protein
MDDGADFDVRDHDYDEDDDFDEDDDYDFDDDLGADLEEADASVDVCDCGGDIDEAGFCMACGAECFDEDDDDLGDEELDDEDLEDEG